MPQRKHKLIQRIDSAEVQGEGSYVIVQNLNLEQAKGLYGSAKSANRDSEDEMLTLGIQILKDLIIEWNWVDDDDNPLPQPKEHPEVLDTLPYQEATFLVTALGLGEARVKN